MYEHTYRQNRHRNRQTDGQTDRQSTSARVELRFAAKNKSYLNFTRVNHRLREDPELDNSIIVCTIRLLTQ